MLHIELEEARKKWPEILEGVLQGEDVLITRNLKPLLKLVRVHDHVETYRQHGSAKGLIRMREDFDEPLADFQAYMS
jgi:antitoxin (DNA-binding transcriptional repressor) of toxin-antitoxin stability system